MVIKKYISYSAILITGGPMDHVTGKTVEVFVPSTGSSCSLPSLADERRDHTLDGWSCQPDFKNLTVPGEDF